MQDKEKGIFNKLNLTTAGFLSVIGIGITYSSKIPGPVILATVTAYGGGTAFATAFYKFRELVKDGTPKENKLDDGLYAGLGIVMSILALNSYTHIINLVKTELGTDELNIIIGGLLVVAAGFFQCRSAMLKNNKSNSKNDETPGDPSRTT